MQNGALHPLRRLEVLESAMSDQSAYTTTSRWMIPYADFLTLLLGFFIVMFALAQMQDTEAKSVEATKNIAMQHEVLPPEQLDALKKHITEELDTHGQQITVSQDARGIVISFQDRIFFGPGRAELSASAHQTLRQLTGVLKKTNYPIRVEGHTDNTPMHSGAFPSNWELSTARATTIVRQLTEKYHFPPARLSAAGYGEFYPLADNSTIQGKQKNRRVDIVLLNPFSRLELPTADSTASSSAKTME